MNQIPGVSANDLDLLSDLVAKAIKMMNNARTPDPDWPDPAVAPQSNKAR